MNEERWRPVVGWEDRYLVSDLGNVFSVRAGHNLKTFPQRNGYGHLKVSFRRPELRQQRTVHTLVADAFLGPRPDGQEVRHGPGGRRDNRLENLCYGTKKENSADRRRDGTAPEGSRNPFAKLTDELVIECRRRAWAGETQVAIGRDLGVAHTTIALAVTGRTWQHVPYPAVPVRPYRRRQRTAA